MSHRVLLVDDAAFMRMSIKRILVENGFDVVGEADNGAMAVDMYGALNPDLVIMDITMPVKDGIEATKSIMESDPSAKIIMCTALGQNNLLMEAIQAGAKDYIVKPFRPERVLEGVNKVLGSGGVS